LILASWCLGALAPWRETKNDRAEQIRFSHQDPARCRNTAFDSRLSTLDSGGGVAGGAALCHTQDACAKRPGHAAGQVRSAPR
jgi:hypothetical protein